ncbi:MAG TPA: amidophosphoribosyltransferase [Candidatus Paceibacterota bacterium]
MNTYSDGFHEECAVFGIYGAPEAAATTVMGLFALQHRGQEGTGIVTYDDTCGKFRPYRALGLVGDTFGNPAVVEMLKGRSAIGHNRYSTAGKSTDPSELIKNLQPFLKEVEHGQFAIAHNGNLIKAEEKRREFINKGAIFECSSDTELFVQYIARSKKEKFVKRFIDTLRQVEGAYSLVVLTANELIGARDPSGFRPLVLGKLGHAFVLASETCAFDLIGAKFLREIKPGEVVVISSEGLKSYMPLPKMPTRFCIFEYIYFARPDSQFKGKFVSDVRKQIGRELAKEHPAEADVVIAVPDSGNHTALGYSEESGIPFDFGIVRSHYVGRTFISPGGQARKANIKLKHNPNSAVVFGKKVVLIDDSIVRANTLLGIIEKIKEKGAKEIHVRIASPPIENPCYYGIDTPEKGDLVASHMTVEEIRKYLGATSLYYISIEGLYRATKEDRGADNSCCDACFTGNYPIPVT